MCLDRFKVCLSGRPQDNALFTYCYLDRMQGIRFHVIATVERRENGELDITDRSDVGMTLRYDERMVNVFPMQDVPCLQGYLDVKKMHDDIYITSEDLKELRKVEIMDPYRHPKFPDDILVAFLVFVDGESQMEQMWVRLEKIEGAIMFGCLLSRPKSEAYGVRRGDRIHIGCIRVDDEYFPVEMLRKINFG